MVNCFLCFSDSKRRKFVSFHSILSSSRTVADVVLEYFPSVPQNIADKPSICSKCFTTMKQFSELVDTVQITHSFPKIQLVKCEAFDLPIKTEAEPFETVSVLGFQPSSEIEGEEVAEDEFKIMLKKEEDEQEQHSEQTTVKLLDEFDFQQLDVEAVVEEATDRFMITTEDEPKKAGQHFSIPVPKLLKRPRFPAREEESDEDYEFPKYYQKMLPTAAKQPKVLKITNPKLKNISQKVIDSNVAKLGLSLQPKVVAKPKVQDVVYKVVKPAAFKLAPSFPLPESQIRKAPPESLVKTAPSETQVRKEQTEKPDTGYIEDIEIECYACRAKLQTFGGLEHHFRIHHPDHLAYFMCCYTIVKTSQQFEEHVEAFHKADGAGVKCPLTGQMFKTKYQLLLHQRKCYGKSCEAKKKYETKKAEPPAESTKVSTPPVEVVPTEESVSKHVTLLCNDCEARFETFSELHKHSQAMHPKSVKYFICCNKVIRRLETFNGHLTVTKKHRQNTMDRVFKCRNCFTMFGTSSDLFEHCMKNYTKYKCTCGVKAEDEAAMKHHLWLHSSYDQHQFECFKCQHECQGYHKLKAHIDASHPLKKERKKQIIRGLTQCDRCGSLAKNLTEHMRRHREKDCLERGEGIPCTQCEKVFGSRISLGSHLRQVHEKRICPICSKLVKNLSSHLTAHKERDRVKCPQCSRYVKNEIVLKNHIKRIHPEVPNQKFECEQCGKVLNSAGSLWCHVKLNHKLKRNLPCRFCPKLMITPTDVKEHEATHTGVDLYFCEWCPKSFKFGASYRGHRKREHKGEYIPRSESKKFVPIEVKSQ